MPVEAGVPLSNPSGDKPMPGGIVPSTIDHTRDDGQHANSWLKYGAPGNAVPRSLPLKIVTGESTNRKFLTSRMSPAGSENRSCWEKPPLSSGVPAMRSPAASSVTPRGRDPLITATSYNPAPSRDTVCDGPPITRSGDAYGVSSVPLGGNDVSSSAETRSGNVFAALCPSTSFTITSSGYVPMAVGAPMISASPGQTHGLVPSPTRSIMPGGSPVTVHVNGAVPPENTPMLRSQRVAKVQSSSDVKMAGSAGGTPTTSIDIGLLYV